LIAKAITLPLPQVAAFSAENIRSPRETASKLLAIRIAKIDRDPALPRPVRSRPAFKVGILPPVRVLNNDYVCT